MPNSMITVQRAGRKEKEHFQFRINFPQAPASWQGQASTKAYTEAQAILQISRRLNSTLHRTRDAFVSLTRVRPQPRNPMTVANQRHL